MSAILAIAFIIGAILVGVEFLQEGEKSINSGSGCGCIFGAIGILFGLGLLATVAGAPIGFIIIALIVIYFANNK